VDFLLRHCFLFLVWNAFWDIDWPEYAQVIWCILGEMGGSSHIQAFWLGLARSKLWTGTCTVLGLQLVAFHESTSTKKNTYIARGAHSVSYSGEYREMVFGTHSICTVSFCDVHLRGGGVVVRVCSPVCAHHGWAMRTPASELCGARDGERSSVNATRRDRNDMLLVRDDQ